MKKRIIATLSAVLAVILLLFTSAFASSAADDGLKNVDGKWIYVKDGVKDTSFTSLVKYYGTWYYVENGELNWNFTGLTDYYGTKYYVENGVLNWNYTGLALLGSDEWYYAENGAVKNDYTGLTYFCGRWFYVEKSALNWNYTGLTKYYDTWYYVENGVLNWDFSGAVLYGKTLYYVNGGRITWDYNGTADYNGVKYIFVGSIAQTGIYKSKYTDYNLVYADGKTGWYDYGDNTYYIGSDGRPLYGNQYIDGKRYFFNANGAKASLFGADFSKHQGTIDWASVKQSGVEFVILRAAVRGYGSSGNLMTDSQIAANIEGALSQNIDVGIYVFSQAVTTEEAVEEAERALDIIKGYDIKLPIYFDSEYSGAPNRTGRADGLTKAERTSLAIAFCETVRNAGYKPGVYASKSFFYNNLGYAAFQSRGYEIWLAHHISSVTDFKYPYNIWQYTSKGTVNGVSDRCDCNYAYKDYPAIMKKKCLNLYPSNAIDLDTTGYKKGDKGNGVLALKYLLMLAKKKGMHNINLDKIVFFGAGTRKAMNNILKNHSYSQNGIAGKKFIDLIGNELLK